MQVGFIILDKYASIVSALCTSCRKEVAMRKPFYLCVIFIAMLVLLSGCSGNSMDGTYISQDMSSQKFIFDGNNVTMSAFGISASGTYEIEGNSIVIKYTLPLLGEQTWNPTFSKKGDNIVIAGTEFIKQ